ncbi:MAG: acetoin utilization protein AcuB [Saprospiraceae bacterium]|jgi:acetoin utilization protein AcuB
MNPEIAIKEIMTTNLVSISPNTPFSEIKAIFEKHDFHHIPVLNPNESIAGMISKTDWLMSLKNTVEQTAGKVWTQKYYDALVAKDIMVENPLVLDPDDSVGLAADIFMANKFHALPIVEDGQVLGILTMYDLMNYAFYKAAIAKE